MISNFLMCLGYVPNDGKETVNFMILERVMVHFFNVLLWRLRGGGISQPVCYKHALCVWNDHAPLDGCVYFSY